MFNAGINPPFVLNSILISSLEEDDQIKKITFWKRFEQFEHSRPFTGNFLVEAYRLSSVYLSIAVYAFDRIAGNWIKQGRKKIRY